MIRVTFKRFALLVGFVVAVAPVPVRPAAPPSGPAAGLTPRAHPNHYILLVDASGSTVQNRGKSESYHATLTRVAELLYGKGFGSVPPYDPEHDYLTLHHFGIVEGDASSAYLRLRPYDLTKALIHPRFVRRSGVTRAELEQAIHPDSFFRLTVLRWAEALALNASGPQAAGAESHRTFLIKVFDGIPNNGTLTGEVDLMRVWGDPVSFQRASQRIQEIEDAYEFAEVSGIAASASTASPVFVAVYDVRPRAQKVWEAQLAAAEPLPSPQVRWEEESSDRAAGRLTSGAAPDLARLLGKEPAHVEITGPALSGSALWEPKRALTEPFTRTGRLGCESLAAEVRITASPRRTDALLGTSTFDFSASRGVTIPPPVRCGVPHLVGRAALITLALGLTALFIFVILFRRFATLIWAKLPGMGRLVRLRWSEPVEYRTSLTVNPGSQFLRLHLPPYLIQALVYRGALVRVAGPGADALRWSDRNDHDPVRVPVRSRTLSLLWRDKASEPDWVEISFDIRSRVARLRLGRIPQ